MSLIEGIGDEVLYAFIVILISVVFVLAWLSTHVNARNFNYVVLVDNDVFTSMRRRLHDLVQRGHALNTGGPQRYQVTSGSLASSSSPQPSDPTPSPNSSPASEPDSSSTSGSASTYSPSYTASDSSLTYISSSSTSSSSSNVPLNDISSFDVLPLLQEPEEASTTDLSNEPDVLPPPTTTTTHLIHEPNAPLPTVTASKNKISDTIEQQTTDEIKDSTNISSNNEQHETASTSNNPENDTQQSNVPEHHIQIRLQYIDGMQRIVHAHPDETIGQFKRRNFSAELDNRSTVRFIMSGQELKNEGTSLRTYKVSDNNVIHCLVSSPQHVPPTSSPSTNRPRPGGLPDIGSLTYPLFGVALGALWYARIFYRAYFNGASTFSLVAITFLYGLSLGASFRNTSPDNHAHLHRD